MTLVVLGQKFSELPPCIVIRSVDVHFLLMRSFPHCDVGHFVVLFPGALSQGEGERFHAETI